MVPRTQETLNKRMFKSFINVRETLNTVMYEVLQWDGGRVSLLILVQWLYPVEFI